MDGWIWGAGQQFGHTRVLEYPGTQYCTSSYSTIDTVLYPFGYLVPGIPGYAYLQL